MVVTCCVSKSKEKQCDNEAQYSLSYSRCLKYQGHPDIYRDEPATFGLYTQGQTAGSILKTVEIGSKTILYKYLRH